MSTVKRCLLCAAIFFGSAAGALAHAGRSDLAQAKLAETVYGSFTRCLLSNRVDLSRLQRGQISILIQDRDYRASNGSSPYEGECWGAS
jgi:hypothetical protein